MIRNIYAIYDVAADVYMGPLVYKADGEALREFSGQAIAADSKIGMNPEDFSLYRIGQIDDAKGTLIPEDRRCLATALEMVAKAQGNGQLKEVS